MSTFPEVRIGRSLGLRDVETAEVASALNEINWDSCPKGCGCEDRGDGD